MLKFNDYLKEAALSAKQKKIAAVAGDKDKIDADDLAALRAGKKPVDEASCYGKDMKKEELVGKQHKLDKNHNGKLDAQDFKMLRKEETEQITESKLEKDYDDEVNKHIPKKHSYEHDEFKVDMDDHRDDDRQYRQGAWHYHKRINDHDKEAQQAHAAGDKKAMHKHLHDYYDAASEHHHYVGNSDKGEEADELAHIHREKAKDHVKEEVQIDEISANLAKNYQSKIGRDIDRANDAWPHGTGDDDEDRKLNKRVKGSDRADDIIAGKAYKKEEVELDEGRMKELAMDLKDMSHDEFHKQYGHPKHHYDPTNFKKPVEPGKGMDRARALAQRGMQSLSKEEVERIEEKLTQLDELSPATLKSYKKGIYRDLDRAADAYPHGTGDDNEDRKLNNRVKGDELASKKLKAKGVEEERNYVSATLKVMDEGKIDNLRDAQKLRRDTQSAYEKDYKPDTSHPHIQVVKGNAYGGANQKDDVNSDENPIKKYDKGERGRPAGYKTGAMSTGKYVTGKAGRGRPVGSKSGARQKGGGHEDGGIPVHNLNLPKSYK